MNTKNAALLFTILLAPPVMASDPAPKAGVENVEFFEKRIRPLLVDACYSCHSRSAKRLEAGLYLDRHSGLLSGGDSGPAVVPGDPDASLIIEAVRYESFEMPPSGKLPQEKIEDLERWVAMGAPWPREEPLSDATLSPTFDWQERKRQHWSWQPIAEVQPPAVADTSWPQGPIDQFILAKLEAKHLSPAPTADGRTLARRLYFDLIGLPPTPAQVQAFLDDPRPDAYRQLVDRLLDSEHFGEKWARHWLDLVRFAETHGHEFDYPIHHAYQYRDYVIRAWNADVPYDQFITEHIAGDLLENPRRHPEEGFNESMIGTGFWFLGEAVHAPTDVRGDEAIRIDNQIDVMSKTFLGLTVACARCHDHKFDPISAEDYYALAGFLQSSCRQEAMLDAGGKIAEAARKIRSVRREADERLVAGLQAGTLDGHAFAAGLLAACGEGADSDDAKRWVEALAEPTLQPAHPLYVWSQLVGHDPRQAEQGFVASRQRLAAEFMKLEQRAVESRQQTAVLQDFDGPTADGWRSTGEAFDAQPTGSGQWDGARRDDGFVRPGVIHSGLSSGKLRGVLRSPTFTITHPKIHYRLNARDARIRLIIDGYFMDEFNGLLFRDANLKNIDTSGEFRWQTQAGDLKNHLGRTAWIEIMDHGDGFAAVDEVCFSDGNPPLDRPCPLGLQIVTDQNVDSVEQLAAAYGRAWDDALKAVGNGSADPPRTALLNWALRHGLVAKEKLTESFRKKTSEIEASIGTPIPVLAITDGTGEDAAVHIRGSHENLGDVVPRRLLVAIAGQEQEPLTEGSGRLELARRITEPANPFPSRVMVNRLWHHLFGRGIVPSVDDFGKMGQPPTHPKLLDWLARDFMQHNWSLKHAIRQMVLSSTYRMSSHPATADSRAEEVDPKNELFHRMPVRRLQAEAIRDAMLAVSGRLDAAMYGPSVPVHLTPFMEGRGRPSSGPLDGHGRRSIYIGIRRNFLSPMMLTFDMPSPFSTMGRRSVSNVPAQSLILMNDPFVIAQARLWAERVLAEHDAKDARITAIFESALSRPPSDRQRERAERFLQQQADLYAAAADDVRLWTDLCHAVLNMKEFIYLN
jgi:hypothetical protein